MEAKPGIPLGAMEHIIHDCSACVCVCLFTGAVSICCLINEMTRQSLNRSPPPVSTGPLQVFITVNSKLGYNLTSYIFFTPLQSHLYLLLNWFYIQE